MSTCPRCGKQNPADAAFCMGCATPLERSIPLREVRKIVTVIFCDVSGSTALGERLDPESLRDVQSRYFDAMRTAIERHGGTVEKYIGDAVMAVFGIPVLHEDDALRATRAAADMREGLRALNEELERDRGVTIAVRIGVNTGEVVAGDPAAGQALVTGDAVNVAARLEQHAAPGEVLLGEATHRLVRDAVRAEPVEPLELKGKAEPVPAYRLLGVTPGVAGHVRRLDSPMVGRERQLLQLHQAFEAAVQDRVCQLFTVLGSAGVGKSRLVEEFLTEIGPSATVLRGRCLSYGEGITYFPVVEAIKQAAGLGDFDLPEVIESRIGEILGEEERSEILRGELVQLMGVGDVASPQETFRAIRRFFEAVARREPLVLVFDDVHWGEPTFLDLVEHIADWSRDAPILLVCMARSELLDARPTWGGGKLNATTISLEPLSAEECGRLFDNLVGTTEIPPVFRDRVIEAAEGDPLFVEESLSVLIDEGKLVRTDGYWAPAMDLSEVGVPPTIAALVAARLDGLSVPERHVLSAAAVIGREFSLGAVQELAPEDLRAAAPELLMGLVRKDLVRPERSTPPGEEAFRFLHLPVRGAAYDALRKEDRAELHERFADRLEREAGELVVGEEEILGYHLEQAWRYRAELGPEDERVRELGLRAAAHLGAAGIRARARGDAPAAASLLGRAVDILPREHLERRRLLPALLLALLGQLELRQMLAFAEEAIEIGRATGDRGLVQWGELERSHYVELADPHAATLEELLEVAEGSVRVFEELGEDVGLVHALIVLDDALWSAGRVEEMLGAAERALDLSLSGRRGELYYAVHQIAVALDIGPTPASQALARMRELAARCAGQRDAEAWATMYAAEFQGKLGRSEEARVTLETARRVFEDLGDPWGLAFVRGEAQSLAWWEGDLVAAESLGRAEIEGWREKGITSNVAWNEADLAHLQCELGLYDEARRSAEEAEALAGPWDTDTRLRAQAARARALARGGEVREAVDLVLSAEETVRATELFLATALVLEAKAQVLSLAGRRDEAIAAAREALEMHERKESAPMAQRARALLRAIETDGGGQTDPG